MSLPASGKGSPRRFVAATTGEGAVLTEALSVLESGSPKLCTFGYSDDEAFAVGLTCGGTIHVFVEPLDW